MLLKKIFQASEIKKQQNADRPDVFVGFYQETAKGNNYLKKNDTCKIIKYF